MYKPIIRLSFDDAGQNDNCNDDIRLAKLLKKYGFRKCVTFYCMPFHRDLVRYLAEDFKIGAHTITHPQDMKILNNEQSRWEIEESKAILEKISERKVRSFCYPRGRYSEREMRYVKRAGFKEARTTIVGRIRTPINPFRLHTSAHICPERPEYQAIYDDNGNLIKPATTWFDEAKRLFDKVMSGKGDYFHIFGHAWEIQKYDQWDNLEEFLYYMRSK